jgi:hypothetical protein
MSYTASSDIITNLDATPPVKERTQELSGVVRTAYAEFTGAVFDALTAGQTAALARVPMNARLKSIKLYHGTDPSTGAFDIGLYRATSHDSGNTVIDADGLADAVDMSGEAASNGLELIQIAKVSEANRANTLGEIFALALVTAGATQDAVVDIVVTIETIMGTAAAMGFEIEYVVD